MPKDIEAFLEKFPIVEGKKKESYIILFDAYTGVGKSTVAKKIAELDNSIILNNDEIRSYLKDYNSNKVKDFQRYRLKKLLENKNSCIMDGCFCHNWEEKLNFYKELGYKYYIIRLECNEYLIKKRLEKRVISKENFSIATYEDYLWMKENVSHLPNELVDFTINTEENIEFQIKEMIKKINK